MPYDKSFKLKLIENFEQTNTSISKIALKKHIPKQTLARWIRLYNKFGVKGLENQKPGTQNVPILAEDEEKICQLWTERKRSVYMMRKDLQRKGRIVSEWQIRKIYVKNKFKY